MDQNTPREWFEKDYYKSLGVRDGAEASDIKRAYKDLARKLHPDQNPGDDAAEERFKEVSSAYEVLGDSAKRSSYDEVRQMVKQGGGRGGFGAPSGSGSFEDFAGGPNGLGDLFGGLFGNRPSGSRRPRGGPQRGRDLETELYVDFQDSVDGVTATVRFTADASCSKCDGTGAKAGTKPIACMTCAGSGAVAQNQGPFSFSQVCPECAGRGAIIKEKCTNCKGKGTELRTREVKVRIPPGVADGQRIRVKERGAAGEHGGPHGDLYVVVHVNNDDVFGRKGNDLTVRVPISFAEAVLGAQIRIPTVDGESVTIKVPAGTAPGTTLRIAKRGISGGSLMVTLEVQVPTDLTKPQKAAVEALAEAFGADPRAKLSAKQRHRPKASADADTATASRERTSESATTEAASSDRRRSDGST